MKILILENDARMPDWPIARFVRKAKKEGHELKYIFNVYNNAKAVIENINWCDALAFGTTWVYPHSILHLTTAIAQHRKEDLPVYIDHDQVEARLEELIRMSCWKFRPDDSKEGGYFELDEALVDEFAYSLRKLKISKITSDGMNTIPVTVLDQRIQRESARRMMIDVYMQSRHQENARTGRFVKIKTVLANGPEFAVLQKDSIVPEIDMALMDPNPNRGVWVMGRTEPVKLLNEDQYDEFELIARCLEDLAEEFVRKCSVEMSKKNFSIVIAMLKDDELNIHDKAKLICDSLGAERRFNKSYMMRRMRETNEQFKFEEKEPA